MGSKFHRLWPWERELQKAGTSGKTSWRQWCLRWLERLWQAVRPEFNPIKRRRKTWQSSPEPFLGVTLLQIQYFDSFRIR